MEKISYPFKQIIGANNDEIEESKRQWNDVAPRNWSFADKMWEELKFEIGEKELAIMRSVNIGVKEIVEYYGGEKPEYFDKNIFVLKKGGVEKVTDGDHSAGFIDVKDHIIAVDRDESDIIFADSLTHELFHLSGYKSLRVVGEERNQVDVYRSGISIRNADKGRTFFHDLEEAIVTEAELLVYNKHLKTDPIFRGEMQDVEYVKGWIERLLKSKGMKKEQQKEIVNEVVALPNSKELLKELRSSKNSEKQKFDYLNKYMSNMSISDEDGFMSRRFERENLGKLVKAISEKTGKNKKDIMDGFFRAHFSGRLLSLARDIEKTLGVGSFSELAETTARKHGN